MKLDISIDKFLIKYGNKYWITIIIIKKYQFHFVSRI